MAYSLLGAFEQAPKSFYLDQPTPFHRIEYCQWWVLKSPAMHLIKRTFTTTGLSSQYTVIPEGSAPQLSTVTEGLATVKENVIIEPPNYYLYGEQGPFCDEVNPGSNKCQCKNTNIYNKFKGIHVIALPLRKSKWLAA